MKRCARLAGLGAGFFCVAICVSCGPSQSSAQARSSPAGSHAGTARMLCFTSPENHKVVISDVFVVKTYPPERMVEEPWAQDFRRYVGHSGNFSGVHVACIQVDSDGAQKTKADELLKQGHEVVETRWRYAGG